MDIFTRMDGGAANRAEMFSIRHSKIDIMRRCVMAELVLCLAAVGQTAQVSPSFDVASVKPNKDIPDRNFYIELGTARHGEVTLHNTNMNDCIRYAYGLTSDDQISGPDWMASYNVRFDIVAKAPPDTSQDTLLLMMQRLLAERFHLTLRTKLKSVAHLELEAAKSGPRMPPSAEEPAYPDYRYGRGLLSYPTPRCMNSPCCCRGN
jgi:Protein of unknown function (DUF3738)